MELLALNKMTTKVHRLQTESFVKIVPRNYLVIFKQTNITTRVCLSWYQRLHLAGSWILEIALLTSLTTPGKCKLKILGVTNNCLIVVMIVQLELLATPARTERKRYLQTGGKWFDDSLKCFHIILFMIETLILDLSAVMGLTWTTPCVSTSPPSWSCWPTSWPSSTWSPSWVILHSWTSWAMTTSCRSEELGLTENMEMSWLWTSLGSSWSVGMQIGTNQDYVVCLLCPNVSIHYCSVSSLF